MTRPAPPRRAGLIVPVPEAERLLQEWRSRLGPTTEADVPAHVTLMFPFLPLAALDAAALADLTALFQGMPGPTVTFASVGLFPDVVYLEPEPREWFVQATLALSARFGILPYSGLHGPTPTPHLTIARHADPAVLTTVARELEQALPIGSEAPKVWLVEEADALGWTHTATFSLGE
ncbi:MAG: 2'-5' RNA ligase family protein [Chloroflexi bacterium]|nr:2'-5' RNA ligase family protein [Chloroflexota bacterium]